MLQRILGAKKDDICPNCGNDCAAADTYCPACGANLDVLYAALPDDWSPDRHFPRLEPEPRLLLSWVAGTAIATPVGQVFLFTLMYAGLYPLIAGAGPVQSDLLIMVALGLSVGVPLGATQWLSLRGWFPRSRAWIWATAIGAIADGGAAWALNWLAVRWLPQEAAAATWTLWTWGMFAAGGALMGVGQWLVLKRYLQRSWLWIAAAAFAWSISSSLRGALLDRVCYPLNLFGFPQYAPNLPCEAMVVGIQGLVLGLITGAVLIGLLRQNGFQRASVAAA